MLGLFAADSDFQTVHRPGDALSDHLRAAGEALIAELTRFIPLPFRRVRRPQPLPQFPRMLPCSVRTESSSSGFSFTPQPGTFVKPPNLTEHRAPARPEDRDILARFAVQGKQCHQRIVLGLMSHTHTAG
jgi:hypothetical protein